MIVNLEVIKKEAKEEKHECIKIRERNRVDSRKPTHTLTTSCL